MKLKAIKREEKRRKLRYKPKGSFSQQRRKMEISKFYLRKTRIIHE